jgi:TonB family protein
MLKPFLSVRTASCLTALSFALVAFTLAARAEDPARAATATAAAPAAHPWPASTTCPRPEYPKEAMQAHWTGVSTVAFLIDTEGKVRNAKVLKSSGHDILDDAALTTLQGCAFRPAMKNGRPVEAWQPIQFVWTLQ